MIKPVRPFNAICHPDCEHKVDGKCDRFYMNRIQLASTVTYYGNTLFIRDQKCVIHEIEKHDKKVRMLREQYNEKDRR